MDHQEQFCDLSITREKWSFRFSQKMTRKQPHRSKSRLSPEFAWTQLAGDANLVGNAPLEQAMDAAMRRLGPRQF